MKEKRNPLRFHDRQSGFHALYVPRTHLTMIEGNLAHSFGPGLGPLSNSNRDLQDLMRKKK